MMQSEVSGNVIDLCPVGALTAKPSRYNLRAWEVFEHAMIAPHDCVGAKFSFIAVVRNMLLNEKSCVLCHVKIPILMKLGSVTGIDLVI